MGRTVVPVQIVTGTSLSGEVNVGDKAIVGIQMPAGWDAAGITFQALTRQTAANPPVSTFGLVQDAGGTEIAITTPAADEYVAISPLLLVGLGRIKVRSGTAGAAVNQTATRDFFLVLAD